MIVDTNGNPVTSERPRRSPRDESCPECGAPKGDMRPTLGGYVTCMQCGYQTREIKSGKKTASR